MLIRKKPPRSHALGEPLRHENHPLPVTRRDFVAAGFLSGPAMVIGPAWLGGPLKARRGNPGPAPDKQALLASPPCKVPSGPGTLPFTRFHAACRANHVASQASWGLPGRRT